LVSEPAAAAVEHHGDLIRPRDPEPRRERAIDDVLGPRHLDLEVVVARAERADLAMPAVERALADGGRVRAREPPALLGVREVFGCRRAPPRAPLRAVAHHFGELGY